MVAPSYFCVVHRSIACFLFCLAVSGAGAAEPDADKPDLEFRGKFKAKEMRFEHVPDVKVRFSGTPGRQDVWTSSRKNFPKPARAGETYRDVEGDVEISTKLPRNQKIPGDQAPPSPSRKQ